MTTALAHPPVSADETAVRGLFQRALDAWGRGDGSAYGALFTDDAEYVAFDGSRTVGRQAIAESHQRLFDTWLKGTRRWSTPPAGPSSPVRRRLAPRGTPSRPS